MRAPDMDTAATGAGACRHWALALIGLILAGRLALAAHVPLVPDEAYYALWSKELSAGYFDHPPMIALFIRLGRLLAGDGPFGIRLVCVLSAIPASVFIWRAADLLVDDPRAGPLAALLYNLTVFGMIGMTLATPDAPLALFCAAMSCFAARLATDGRTRWWLCMGAATGLAMQAKYSAALLAAGFSLGVLALPVLRRQILTVRPWLALGVAVLVFLPNIVWNIDHDWASFAKQGGRVTAHWQLSARYLPELAASQIGLATPLIFMFGILGLLPRSAAMYRSGTGRTLVLCMLLVPTAYFLVHGLHSRVEGNWLGFLYPLFAIAAAAGMLAVPRSADGRLAVLRRLAVPMAAVLLVGVGIQAAFVPVRVLGAKDPIVRMTRGWPDFVREVEDLRRSTGASYILTNNYQLNAVLARELPDVPVEQFNERARYIFLGQPDPAGLTGPGLVLAAGRDVGLVRTRFAAAEPLGTLSRRFDGLTLATVRAYRIDQTPADIRARGSAARPQP